jgi:anti-sigma B factor antagonist
MTDRANPQSETIYYARPSADIVVFRIDGRGSHLNSPALQQVAETCLKENPQTRFVFDLKACPTMDSTFMGALAGVTLRQQKNGGGKSTVVNLGPQILRLLEVLGLVHILDIRGESEDAPAAGAQFRQSAAPDLSKLDRTVHMIQAHEQLVSLDGDNEVKFEGVLQCLKESLERQKQEAHEK